MQSSKISNLQKQLEKDLSEYLALHQQVKPLQNRVAYLERENNLLLNQLLLKDGLIDELKAAITALHEKDI